MANIDKITKTCKTEQEFLDAIVVQANSQDNEFCVEISYKTKSDSSKAASGDEDTCYGTFNLSFATRQSTSGNKTYRDLTYYNTDGYFSDDFEVGNYASSIMDRLADSLLESKPPIRTERQFGDLVVYSAKKDLKDKWNNQDS